MQLEGDHTLCDHTRDPWELWLARLKAKGERAALCLTLCPRGLSGGGDRRLPGCHPAQGSHMMGELITV